jgi:hypothetical protein
MYKRAIEFFRKVDRYDISQAIQLQLLKLNAES